jgi:gamma-glutamyltranspeptidase/glutathione hydrolase
LQDAIFGIDVARQRDADHPATLRSGRILGVANAATPDSVRARLREMGYTLEVQRLTSGPITAIFVDREHGSFWGGASNFGEDYGIAW